MTPQKHTPTIGCFRGSLSLPNLKTLIETHQLNKKFRILERRQFTIPCPYLQSAEKKIERKIRSKSHLDSLFELCPHHPWRQTTQLSIPADDPQTILELDFKNFHPALLCHLSFPHPAHLLYTENPPPNLPGITHCRLHPKPNLPPLVRELHPFQIQFLQKSAPFYLDSRPIETLLHNTEIPILSEWFELEFLGTVTTSKPIDHPLKKKTLQLLEELSKNPEKQKEIKKIINSFCTTPKIGSPKNLPSPYGVHAFSSQIQATARTILFQTIHQCLNIHPEGKILQINTDGFHILTPNPNQLLSGLQNLGLLNNQPGGLRVKSQAHEGFFLGPNVWWTFQNHTLEASRGNKTSLEPIPLKIPIKTPNGWRQFPLIHLADFQHQLNHKTLERKKFTLPQEITPLTPLTLCQNEKTRSFHKTLSLFRTFRKKKTPSALPGAWQNSFLGGQGTTPLPKNNTRNAAIASPEKSESQDAGLTPC